VSRILLIEDETSTQNLLQNRLRDLGHDVEVASTGARGLMTAREERFHLFLVDIGLGSGIDGFEVCRRLKAMPQLHSIPVVLISGQVKSQEDLHRGYEAGCESFLVKGDLTLMEDVVRAMLRIKTLQDDLGLQNRLLEEQNRRLQEERKRGEDLETALRESGSRGLVFRELAAGHPDGSILVDGEGIVRFADRGARDIAGSDIEGKNIGSISRGSGLEAFVRDARTEPREGFRFDLGHRSMSASVIPLMPRTGTNERPYKAVLLLDAGRRRVAAEMLRMEEQGTPRRELGPLLDSARRTFHPSAYPGDSDVVRELRARTTRFAITDSPVLISGEIGTGQEWIARSLHFGGPRSGPFIPVNCAALDPDLLESELFGFAKGAFPDAVADRPGLFQQADHGTLLLAGVEALSPEVQAKLVGVLETGEVYRVGYQTPERVDVRVVASTTADLSRFVAENAFRSDLYYLLNSNQLSTPALRERGDDVLHLARLHLQRHGTLHPELRFSDEVLWLFLQYEWPGNERELENCVESACSVASSDTVEVNDLSPPLVDLHRRLTAEGRAAELGPGAVPGLTPGERGGSRVLPGAFPILEEEIPLDLGFYERLCLERALRETGGDKRKSARLLGMGKSTFYRKLKTHSIEWPRAHAPV
jgi:DNA-binding NtrC family response regulator